MSASDVEQSNKLTNKRRYEVTVRAGSGITTAHRLLWDGKYLSVNAAIDDERSRQTLLTCTEVAE
jgi:head-tail adaptor